MKNLKNVKGKYITCFVLLFLASVFFAMKNFNQKSNYLIDANIEALAGVENGNIPTIPCLRAVSICEYLVQDASGKVYFATTSGMRHK